MPDPTAEDEEDMSMCICKEPPVRSRRVHLVPETPTDAGEDVDPVIKAAVARILGDRERALFQEFAAFRPECVQTLKDRIDMTQAFLASATPLDTHLHNAKRFLTAAERIAASASALTEWMAEHTPEKVERLKEQLEVMSDTHFDPTATLRALQDAYWVLNDLEAYDIIPLPPGTVSLTLEQKNTYVQVEDANDLYRALMRLASGPIVRWATEIKSYSKRLSAIESEDTPEEGEDTGLDRWGRVAIHAEATMDLVTALSTAQTNASALLTQWKDVKEVTVEDLEDASIERDTIGLHLGYDFVYLYVSVSFILTSVVPLSDQKRAMLTKQHDALSTKVASLVAQRETRVRLSEELRPYLFLPEVASALGEPLRGRKVDLWGEQDPCDWGNGLAVSGGGLIEGHEKRKQILAARLASIFKRAEKYITANWSTAMTEHPIVRIDCNPGLALGCPAMQRFLKGIAESEKTWEDLETTFGWHGTTAKAIPLISHHGFDPSYRSSQVHGPGEYFALTPSQGLRSCSRDDVRMILALLVRNERFSTCGIVSRSCVVNNPIHFRTTYCLPVMVVTFDSPGSLSNRDSPPRWICT
ncbi:hypothetical protein KIPB_009097 [Kipferlia bialata]|uniref:Uncharacterized protein n=1 Tax=Kipferlia bialata TaxID=797122 RepID=A0A9K3D1R1_9EUKA|nr:hypothetical protein KIPB_009097 [Kipferlia bialata]|eukprot:g9097.t1